MSEMRRFPSIPEALRAGASLMVVVLCALVLTFGALFYLWQRYQFISLGFEVERLRALLVEKEVECDELRREIALLKEVEMAA